MTDEYGISAADFQLADEVNEGAYTLRAIMEQGNTEKTVTVERYVLPKFKVVIDTDKKYYLPAEKITGKIQVDYFFG